MCSVMQDGDERVSDTIPCTQDLDASEKAPFQARTYSSIERERDGERMDGVEEWDEKEEKELKGR